MGRRKHIVIDEFTNLNVSEQAKRFMRKKRDGKCFQCDDHPADGSNYCLAHLKSRRIARRIRDGWGKRRAERTRKLTMNRAKT